MDYKKEIAELRTELKGFDCGNIGKVAGDKEEDKPKRKICILNAYEELKRIEEINKKLQDDKIQEKEEAEEHREPLSIDKEEVYKILLSWGGGSDGFKLTFQNGELLRGVYFMGDWGEYQEIELNNKEAEEVYNFYMYGDVASFKQD